MAAKAPSAWSTARRRPNPPSHFLVKPLGLPFPLSQGRRAHEVRPQEKQSGLGIVQCHQTLHGHLNTGKEAILYKRSRKLRSQGNPKDAHLTCGNQDEGPRAGTWRCCSL